jgi:hypothetical protein
LIYCQKQSSPRTYNGQRDHLLVRHLVTDKEELIGRSGETLRAFLSKASPNTTVHAQRIVI